MIKPYRDHHPKIHPSVYVDETAQVVGRVEIGEESSLWCHAVARGDVNEIRIGRRTNVQDAALLHVTHETHPLVLGDEITVGHGAILHGCTIQDRCLIGMGATILDGAVVGEESIIGAGALVTEGKEIPPRSLAVGAPARVIRKVTDEELKKALEGTNRYVLQAREYRSQSAGQPDMKASLDGRRRYEIQDRSEPELFEETFPFALPPLIRLQGRIVDEIDGRPIVFDPREIALRDIFITDTTFRDGQQARPPYTVDQTARLFELLARLGGPNGVIRQTEFFLYSSRDRAAVERCRALGLKYPEVTAWIRADLGDLKLVKETGLSETGILTSVSDYHIYYKQRATRREAIEGYLRVVEEALSAGIRPRCHLEDLTRADMDGCVLPFVQKLAELSEQVPESLRIKVRLCDTMGVALSYPGVSLPRSIAKLVYTISREGGIPSHRLEWHGHNDFHQVHINGVAAWLYGCDALNTTVLGFGERTGNPPLEAAVMEYIGLKGELNGVDPRVITEIATYCEGELGFAIPKNEPHIGAEFNLTRAGIHAKGLAQDLRTYNSFDTEKLLGRPAAVAINDKSGADGVALWVNRYLGLTGDESLSKTKIARIARWVADQYEQGRITSISEEEMAEQIRKHLSEHHARRAKRAEKSRP
jgi:carbonic anhydrase/acetyltransferase-like protein (isoleucine patch superfamily)/isopropylmalate/homocitrate/citramalate synthase